MRVLRRTFVLSIPALAGLAQDPAPSPDAQFVSGTVTELPPGKIVVNRAVLGKPPENRTFLINPETKIEGTLALQVRVTVGFRTNDEGEAVAVRIIVRPQKGKP